MPASTNNNQDTVLWKHRIEKKRARMVSMTVPEQHSQTIHFPSVGSGSLRERSIVGQRYDLFKHDAVCCYGSDLYNQYSNSGYINSIEKIYSVKDQNNFSSVWSKAIIEPNVNSRIFYSNQAMPARLFALLNKEKRRRQYLQDFANVIRCYSKITDKSKFSTESLVNETIKASKEILDYPKGWDGEEGLPVDQNSWERAIQFLDTYTRHIYKVYDRIIVMPNIDNVADASIYLSWMNNRAELNIKFKAGESYEVHYYGDVFGNTQVIKSILKKNNIDEVLAFWMKENLYENIPD